MKLLSVIVPVYRVEQYLPQCIDSILAQTLEDMEIILVDDGSPDNSGKICDAYAEKHENIKVIHKENEGLTAARKTGIEAAEGKYFAFVDSDDWIDPDMYQVLVSQAEEHGADIVTSGYVAEYPDHTQRRADAIDSGVYTGGNLVKMRQKAVFDAEKMCQGLMPSTCTKVYLKERAVSHFLSRKDSVSFGEDALFTYPVLFSATCVVVDQSYCGYHYRQWGGSMTHVFSQKYFDDLHVLHSQLCAAAEPIMTDKLRLSLSYNYVFLFANGVYQIMGRGNRESGWKKYQRIREQSRNQVFHECAEQVQLERFPKNTAAQLRLLHRNRPGQFVLHYFLNLITSRVKRLFG